MASKTLNPVRRQGVRHLSLVPTGVIRVLILHTHALERAGLCVLLEREADIDVVGEASEIEQAVLLGSRLRPDVMLVDAGPGGLDAYEASRRVLSDPQLRDTAVLLLSRNHGDEHVLDALRAGASGLLFEDSQPSDLVSAVRLLATGGTLLPRSAARRVMAAIERADHRPYPRPIPVTT
ncbi:MAG: response regulator transcription factor [Thermoleophilaceae bacterium]